MKKEISSYARDVETVKRVHEKKQHEDKEWQKNQIMYNANALYEEKIEAYMAMNFWGKAKTLFAGKKPKKLSQQGIIQEYGTQALEQITSPAKDRLIMERDAQIEMAKKDFANYPKQLEYAMKAINEYYKTRISQGQEEYNKTLNDLQGGRLR